MLCLSSLSALDHLEGRLLVLRVYRCTHSVGVAMGDGFACAKARVSPGFAPLSIQSSAARMKMTSQSLRVNYHTAAVVILL
jgi:hypothetical protein